MRKLLLLGGLLLSINSQACDVCGCATIGFGFDDLSGTTRNAIGLRYGLRQFNSSGLSDYYHQAEINGLYSINSKWLLRGSLPYLLVNRDAENAANLNGVGDATLAVRFTPINKMGDKSVQSFTIGAGVNMPTGTFQDRKNSLLSPNFQTGTGSWDVLFESRYSLFFKKWRIGIQAAYLFNNENTYGYIFGDQFVSQASLGYGYELNSKSTIIPAIEVSYEHFAKDVNSRGYYQYGTGGQALNAVSGFSYLTTNWYFTAKAGTNIFNESAGSYKPATQVKLSVSYLF
jgi:hypothetical protein